MTRARHLLNYGKNLKKSNVRFFAHLIYKHPEISEAEAPLIQKSKFKALQTPLSNLTNFIFKNVYKWSDKVALECGVTGRQYTYADVEWISERFRSALYNFGAVKGDKVCLALPNVPEYPILLLGTVMSGLTLTPMNPSLSKDEMTRQLLDSSPQFIVTTKVLLEKMKQACKDQADLKLKKFILLEPQDDFMDPDCISLRKMLEYDHCYYSHLGNTNIFKDPAILPYSNKSYAPSKGSCLTHQNLVLGLDQLTDPNLHLYYNNKQESTIAALPFFHMQTLITVLLHGLHIGSRIVTLPSIMEPNSFLKCMTKHKPTWLTLNPTILNLLLSKIDHQHLQCLQLITSYGAPLATHQIKSKFQGRPIDVREGFGMTETCALSFLSHLNSRGGNCGTPLTNTLAKIIDIETGDLLGPEEHGELCIAGPQVMTGYYNNPKATDKVLKDGWLHTGDLAFYDHKGRFTIMNKIQDWIKVKDHNVSPSTLESLILAHPGVKEVAVVGVQDYRYGQLPRAYVVKDENYKKKVTEDMIFAQVLKNERTQPHEYLHGGVVFVDDLPKCANFKVLKRELKAKGITVEASFG